MRRVVGPLQQVVGALEVELHLLTGLVGAGGVVRLGGLGGVGLGELEAVDLGGFPLELGNLVFSQAAAVLDLVDNGLVQLLQFVRCKERD